MNRCLTWILTLLAASPGLPQSRTASVVIAHANVVDVANGLVLPDMTVVIGDRRIISVGRAARVRPPRHATIVDARGKYLIPGLCDMHAHLFSPDRKDVWLPLYVANGVTCVRDMAESMALDEVNRWRNQIDRGEWLGPHVVAIAGKLLDGPTARWPAEIAWRVHSADEARAIVDDERRNGVDFIKIYDGLPDEELAAVFAEAKKLQIPVAGHLPYLADAARASDAGMRSVEHLRQMLQSISRREKELRVSGFPGTIIALSPAFVDAEWQAARSIDPHKEAALLARFNRNGTWQVPTLVLDRKWKFYESGDVPIAGSLQYLPRQVAAEWKAQFERANLAPADRKKGEEVFEAKLALVGRMHRAGAGILVGTDANGLAASVVPGFSVHDELALLVKAGLSPLAALQAATIQPARFMGTAADFGSIDDTKRADLVLLDDDPTRDISNTRKISAVVVNGRYLDRQALDSLLGQVKQVAAGR